MLHVHVPHSEDRVLQYFGATAESLPMAVIADMSSPSAIKKYMYVHLSQRKRGGLRVNFMLNFILTFGLGKG